MNFFASIFNRTNLIASGFGGACSVVGLLVALNQGSIDKAVSENVAITSLKEQLTAQQRQLDVFERRQSAALGEVKKEQELLRREALVYGSERNKMAVQELNDRFDALAVKIETLPKVAGGGVDPIALGKAVEQVKLDLTIEFQRWLAEMPVSGNAGISESDVQLLLGNVRAELMTSVSSAIEAKFSSLSRAVGDGVPIATKRRIHFVEKDCVYLQSMPKQFTQKFRRGQEFCWEPSQLWFEITKVDSYRFYFRYVGGGSYDCYYEHACYIGSEEDGTRYKVRVEQIYEKDAIVFAEVNFLKID
ncbi:hypothetical protein FEE96_15000 [Parasedimentitalea maritima]|uniref:OmpH family outer membrane protein n=1 Tax=Parasedimentitalea maritima TaxID=2578117 RepID=A0ABY2UT39_9RHOB|nr:hypothetical protein [Zongyanglinia marina]TLP61542.1 hypothetical protein FEE96_15000 [Zongyanglinia marina]